jgi:hypothetical protein
VAVALAGGRETGRGGAGFGRRRDRPAGALDRGSGSVAHSIDANPHGVALAWRWKVDRVVQAADMERRSGDDYAARVYVFFDVPRADLPWNTRIKIAAIELIYGKPVPTAAICYVWDNRHPVGASQWNAYTDRVRMVVLRSGAAEAGEWNPSAATSRPTIAPRSAPAGSFPA